MRNGDCIMLGLKIKTNDSKHQGNIRTRVDTHFPLLGILSASMVQAGGDAAGLLLAGYQRAQAPAQEVGNGDVSSAGTGAADHPAGTPAWRTPTL